ncbi:PaaI family thioesterase [Chelatococcus reniformis]|uniref:Thioesterase n=1 Tax=Chelatococcus reniformis TaxID=1494448 RepID=A0A916XMJ4_9HYPH|nr:PaaI family thioesterase [Chelatococcus reniformis]GGC82795.1 thioesterase [Chelatococcus reniformis]
MEGTPPRGFAPFSRIAPVLEPWTPIYACEDGDILRLGTFIRRPLCNNRGLVHGGVVSTLADIAMGVSLVMARRRHFPDQASPLTTSLAVDYIAGGTLGLWLEVVPRIVHAGRASGVVDAIVTVGDEVVARAAATFRLRAESTLRPDDRTAVSVTPAG